MSECFKVTIWRLFRVDLAKLWPEISASLNVPFNELSERVEQALDFVAAKHLRPLYAKLVEELEKKFGSEFVEALSYLEKVMEEAGNYSSTFEPAVGFIFFVQETLHGVLSELPEAVEKVVSSDKKFAESGKFGELFKEPLVYYKEEDESLMAMMGLVVERMEGEVCYFALM